MWKVEMGAERIFCFLVPFWVVQTLQRHSEITLFHFFEWSGIDPIYATVLSNVDMKLMGNKNSFGMACTKCVLPPFLQGEGGGWPSNQISAGGRLSLQLNFQKGGLARTSTFREGLPGKSEVTFFRGGGGCNFPIKTN